MQALAEQGDDRAADARPRTPTERRLAAAWAAALDWPVARIGRHDSFADLGGGSLSAMRVVSSLDGLVTLPQLLDTPVLSELAAALDRSAGTTPAGSGTARADAAGGGTATAVRARPATAGRATARRVAPAGPATMDCTAVVDVAAWATAHRTGLDAALRSHGAVHLTGLPVRTPADLAALRDALGRAPVRPVEPFADRTDLGHDVWSAPEWGADREQCLHHDESYSLTVPGLLLFACRAPARTGGALLLGDTRAALAALPADLAARFRAQGWRFERTFRPGFGPRPATAFGTDDVAAIERACAQRLVSVEDQRDGVLRLSRLRSALVTHPVTGEECWFNDVGFFSAWALDPTERALLRSSFGERGLPFDARFGAVGQRSADGIRFVLHAMRPFGVWQPFGVLRVDEALPVGADIRIGFDPTVSRRRDLRVAGVIQHLRGVTYRASQHGRPADPHAVPGRTGGAGVGTGYEGPVTSHEPPETTEDGHFVVIAGRRWRATDPAIPEDSASVLRRALMAARRDVGSMQRAGQDPKPARARVQLAKVALGERGTPWWEQTPEQRQQRWEQGLRDLEG